VFTEQINDGDDDDDDDDDDERMREKTDITENKGLLEQSPRRASPYYGH